MPSADQILQQVCRHADEFLEIAADYGIDRTRISFVITNGWNDLIGLGLLDPVEYFLFKDFYRDNPTARRPSWLALPEDRGSHVVATA